MNGHEGAWRVPGYSEVRRLGTGGSGQVVLARRLGDDFPVAIKYLSDQLRSDLSFVAAFRHEARLLSIMRSPHAARLYEYVESAGGAAIIMELVDGVSLRALLRTQGPTGPEAALVVLKGALLGLEAAHQLGVVHRDFKPENVIVDGEGNSKIVDFGIAVRAGADVSGAGTPAYMAPEQWSGAPATPATDVYAATVVFFECLTGAQPFHAQSVAAIARLHQVMPPPVEQVPEPVRGLIESGLAKHPAERPPSAEAFLTELEAVAAAAYGSDWEARGRRRLARLAGLLSGLFPLGEETPETASALAETRLPRPVRISRSNRASRASRRLGVNIAIGAGAVVAVLGATVVVAGMASDTELSAHSAAASPRLTLSPAPAEPEPSDPDDGSGDSGEDDPEPSATPEDSASPTPTDPAASPVPTTAPVNQPRPPGTGSPAARPSRTPTRSGVRTTSRPPVTPVRTRASDPEPEFSSTDRSRPRGTATSAPSSAPTRTAAPQPPATSVPRPTRTPPTAVPTRPSPSSPTPSDPPSSEPTISTSDEPTPADTFIR